jgi:ectoine hydroxylase-related dioxygenase (phytanoyl-CoA dioxygenase family)
VVHDALREAWSRDGFFFARGLVAAATVAALTDELIGRIRGNPPDQHPGQDFYFLDADLAVTTETDPTPEAAHAEDWVSKLFSAHTIGAGLQLAGDSAITDVVAALLDDDDIDCFQSQFILKNPGVIGQPWHQDSYYFAFDRQPQIGVWVALSEATLANGCLWVLPGSHTGRIHRHVPDRRPAANRGYLEIIDQDTRAETPALMAPGDVLFFHSFLMHRSKDNLANTRRAAMVYHYGRAGTRGRTPEVDAALAHVNRWVPVRRRAREPGAPASGTTP